jgi:2,4-dienoyl-CoA reductase-like NADH-dependent reductase (Old Yellow Enzyme family)/thioredoxin reductase
MDAMPSAGLRRLFEPISLGDITLRNRIANTTHKTTLSEARELRYLEERARGGAGLLVVQGGEGARNFGVGPAPQNWPSAWDEHPISPLTPEGVAHYDNYDIPRLKERARVIHAGGAKCFGQLFHLGAGLHATSALPTIAPSSVADPFEGHSPHAMTVEEIEGLIFAFGQAIRRVRAGGFDGVELHAAHGYLLCEFLSPYFNRRDDLYGGSRENRVRLLLRIVEEARKLVGDFPIAFRIGTDGIGEAGIDDAELVAVAKLLEPHATYFSISNGNYSGLGAHAEAYVGTWNRPPAYNAALGARLKAAVKPPVIVTGRITDAALAESLLAEGSADIVGMVRALIADPDLPNKARAGKADQIRPCLAMSECHFIGERRTPVTCAVNPAAGREDELQLRPLVGEPKTIVIVGAGPAGMEAARVAAMRGHVVYLADEARLIGGTPRLLAADPNRRILRDQSAYYEALFKDLDVTLSLGTRVEAEDLASFEADVAIIATGGTPLIPEVPGIDEPNVVTTMEVLRDPARVGPRALVVGGLDGHIAGPTIAEFLADRGVVVEYINEHLDFAHGAEGVTRIDLLRRLLRKGVGVKLSTALVGVGRGGAEIENLMSNKREGLRDATVVIACGLVANDSLARQLGNRIPALHLIGDALAARRIMHATLEGARVANNL